MENLILSLLKSDNNKIVKLNIIEKLTSTEHVHEKFHLNVFYKEIQLIFNEIIHDSKRLDELYSLCVFLFGCLMKVSHYTNEYKTLFNVNHVQKLFQTPGYEEKYIFLWSKLNIQIATQHQCFTHEVVSVLVDNLIRFVQSIELRIELFLGFIEILELLQPLFNIILTNSTKFLDFFKELNDYSIEIIRINICFLANYQLTNANANEVQSYFKNLNKFIKFTTSLMEKNDSLYVHGINTLMNYLASNKPPTHMAQLFGYLDRSKASHLMLSDDNISVDLNADEFDSRIKHILENLIYLLTYPLYDKMHLWIGDYVRRMIRLDRTRVLIEICDEKLDFLLTQSLFSRKATREPCLFMAISFLLNYQHSPKLFNSNIVKLCLCLERFKIDSDVANYTQLAYACVYCVKQLNGFENSLYKPLLDLIHIEGLNEEKLNEFAEKYAFNAYQEARLDTHMHLKREHITGLVNFGNTCYLNCVVQALYSCKKFVNLMFNLGSAPNDNYSSQLKRLFAYLYLSRRPSIQANEFIDKCIPVWFCKGQQQDSSEYLMFLLDNLNEELKETTTQGHVPSLISNLFSFKTQVDVVCLNCKNKTSTQDTSFIQPLSFPLQKDTCFDQYASVNLNMLFANYYKTEELSEKDNNLYSCGTCASLQQATRIAKLSHTSDYFIISLNRFAQNAQMQSNKIMNQLESIETFEVLLNFDTKEPIKVAYELQAVVLHAGVSLNHGHYYSYVHLCANTWLLLNDEHISTLSINDLRENLKKFKDDTPYILIYKKQNVDSIEMPIDLLDRQLQFEINRDNQQYENELRARNSSNDASTNGVMHGPHNKPKDDDDDWGDPPSTSNMNGPRFVC